MKNASRRRPSGLMIFALFMIFSGVLILLYPIVGNYLANRERSEASDSYKEVLKHQSETERKKQYRLAQQYNMYIFQRQQGKETVKVDYRHILDHSAGIMGMIDIPAIGIKQMPFYHGTSYKTLDKGLGHLEDSSIPIGGVNTRAVITGHSGIRNQVLFSDTKNLEKGDIFYIHILGKHLAYQIDSFVEVLPSDAEKVKIVPGKDQVTLLTCTPPGINTYRLLITGHRVPYHKALNQKVKRRNLWSYQNVVLTTLLFNLLLFIILAVIYRCQLKKFRSSKPEIALRGRKRLRQLFLFTRMYFILIFLTMIAIVGIAIYGYTKMQEQTTLAPIVIGRTENLKNYNRDKITRANYEEQQIASVNVSDYAKAKSIMMETINNCGVGKLAIPKVSIDVPILAGLTNENLLTGVATYRSDQQLGKGNYVLLSHNIFDQDVLLHRIKQLKKGDRMYLTDFQRVYVYRVFRNEVIYDTEMSVVEKNIVGQAQVTLLRCEGNVGTKYRRLVQGKLQEVTTISHSSKRVMKELGLKKTQGNVHGKLITQQPISAFQQFAMLLAAKFVSDPVQTMIPMFLFLVLPILFFTLMR